MSQLINKYRETLKANNNDHYTTISVRTSAELGAMIETASVVTQQAVVNLFTGEMSAYLANYALADRKTIPLIEEVLQQGERAYYDELHDMIKGSFVEILQTQGAMTIDGLANEFALDF